MTDEAATRLMLTPSQADCLIILRNGNCTMPGLAVQAKFAMNKVRVTLHKLTELGLVKQNDARLWAATARGRVCRFETIFDQPSRAPGSLGPGAQRLLALLDRPRHGRDMARKLGVSRQRVRQLILKLHAQGLVDFGDPINPSWILKRADDKSPLLAPNEERVLSVLPREHATDATRLTAAAKLPTDEVERIVGKLVADGLAEAFEGLRGRGVFRITAAGLEHPQYVPSMRRARPPRLPVQSDRILAVLQTVSDAGGLRIRDVKHLTKVPPQSVNALMQYLKRKQLVSKAGPEFDAPYSLTEQGRVVLVGMKLHRAA